MGIKFTVYHLFNNDLVILRTHDYKLITSDDELIEGKNFRKIPNAKRYSVYARNLLWLNTDNCLMSLLYDKSHQIGDLINVELAQDIQHFWNGYSQLVIQQKLPETEDALLQDKREVRKASIHSALFSTSSKASYHNPSHNRVIEERGSEILSIQSSSKSSQGLEDQYV